VTCFGDRRVVLAIAQSVQRENKVGFVIFFEMEKMICLCLNEKTGASALRHSAYFFREKRVIQNTFRFR
jgi:hypothetical protein